MTGPLEGKAPVTPGGAGCFGVATVQQLVAVRGEPATPEDVAKVVTPLAGDLADCINGAVAPAVRAASAATLGSFTTYPVAVVEADAPGSVA